jgi:RNA polymerase sigma-70 factor (ECF subfamily)
MRLEEKIDFGVIARVHFRALFSRAFSLTRSEYDAWDLVQNTFERAIRSPPRRYDKERALCWLLTILRNQYIDLVRSRKVRRHMPLTPVVLDQLPTPMKDDGPPPWHSIPIEKVEELATQLPVHLRVAFAYSTTGLPRAEIAARLQIPVATVTTRIFRGRRRLRQMLLSSAMGELASETADPVPSSPSPS